MGQQTAIEWTHHTFNPWRGCSKVSAGCANCYAEALSRRNPAVLGEWGPEGQRVIASETAWREPLKWDRAAAKAGERQPPGRPGHVVMTRQREGTHSQESTVYTPPTLANPGNVIDVTVGGGQMGSPVAHQNEAPYPEALVEPFILSFCPPGGIVLDPFLGSGTTAAVAIRASRRALGCDVRQSQVDLATRRVESITPPMFAE